MKLKVFFIIILFVVCSGFSDKTKEIIDKPNFSDKTKKMMDRAVSINKEQLPMEIDEETVWVDLIANNEGLTYIYKLKTLTIESIDLSVVIDIIDNNVTNHCNSKFISTILNEGGTITFIYLDTNGKNIITRGYKKDFCLN